MDKEDIKKLIGSCVYNYCGPRYEDIGHLNNTYKFFTKLNMHFEVILHVEKNNEEHSLYKINGTDFEFNWSQFIGSTIKLNNEIILKAWEHSIEISDAFVNWINNNI